MHQWEQLHNVFPIKLFPGDLVEIEKASFIMCCSKQNISRVWIGTALDMHFIIGMILDEPEPSFTSITYNNDQVTDDRVKKMMYKTYVLGRIVKLDERCFRSKI